MPEPLYILAGLRTPFCRAGTALATLSAEELGRQAAAALLTRTGIDPAAVDEVIFGCVCQPPESPNLARHLGLRAGLPASVPALTVQRNCASGLEAITTAAERLASGHGALFLVGGVESMSQAPLLFPAESAAKFTDAARAKTPTEKAAAYAAFRPADFSPRSTVALALRDSVTGLRMGETAELLAREHGISRLAQDLFATRSHERALAARSRFAEEIAPVFLAPGEGAVVQHDIGPREGVSVESLASLKPAFDAYGTVTAGNSSPLTDGAVALLVGSAERAQALGLTPLGRVVDYTYTGCDPARMGLGPVSALERLQQRTGRSLAEADLVELNEAFAAQVLSVLQHLRRLGVEPPAEKLNVNGGALALGHPVGATGARLVLTALLKLRHRQARQAVVSLCVGGGQGAALWLERDAVCGA